MNIPQVALQRIIEELKKAEEKFPGFPQDVVHGWAIMAEECGEAGKEALDVHYGRSEGHDRLMEEVAQTGAMSLRFLIRLLDEAYYQPQEGGDEV